MVNGNAFCSVHHAFLCYGPKFWNEGETVGPFTHCGRGPTASPYSLRGFVPNEHYCFDCADKINKELREIEDRELALMKEKEENRKREERDKKDAKDRYEMETCSGESGWYWRMLKDIGYHNPDGTSKTDGWGAIVIDSRKRETK